MSERSTATRAPAPLWTLCAALCLGISIPHTLGAETAQSLMSRFSQTAGQGKISTLTQQGGASAAALASASAGGNFAENGYTPIPDPQLAMSSKEYPVTSGDVYTLAYAAGTTPVTYSILVDPTCRIRVSNLAVIEGAGKTFPEIKAQVEAIVSKNYPFSGVQFAIVSPSVFRVTLKGEVSATAEQSAWALSRLSAVIAPYLTTYSSIRDVRVTSSEGKTVTYDLFRAQRGGDLSQDPYLRPGDVITIGSYERLVTVSGAVKRPGTYQLKSGEGLRDLIDLYGNGFDPLADSSRMELVRHIGAANPSGGKTYLSAKDIDSDFALKNRDEVVVPKITDLMPVMFFEGAVRPGAVGPDADGPGADSPAASPDTSNRVTVRYTEGENYASLVRRYSSSFTAVSDTSHAYVIRADERIPMNLNPMLYDVTYVSEYVVQNSDVLVIPFRQYFVTVSGAVAVPGRYPYIPDRDWSYYVALAGGFNPLRNAHAGINMTDVTGKKLAKTDVLPPEATIEAKNDAFLYYFNQYAPVVTTTLTVISSVFTIIAVTQ